MRSETSRVLITTARAQHHEFANCLHTVAGLLHMEMYDRASEFIAELTRARTTQTRRADHVREPVLSALLVGKSAVAAERGVTLHIGASTSLPRRALVPHDLMMVLGNLIDNALDAVAARPVPDPRVDVDVWAEGDTVILRVADNGPGVPPDARPHVFIEGWSTKEPHHGRGVGLAQVRRIADQYDGTVALDERAGGGAVFTVRLPRALAPEAVVGR
ncbi:sensor histidine kinase [Streptomyces sp. NPDC052301]|uniref:sensor histidine kinase n=1 Tax=Streptomyces sp. NPDC052301 TaxID=3365687 RepID=UPI0037D2072B